MQHDRRSFLRTTALTGALASIATGKALAAAATTKTDTVSRGAAPSLDAIRKATAEPKKKFAKQLQAIYAEATKDGLPPIGSKSIESIYKLANMDKGVSKRNMVTYADKPMNRVRVGVIGLGHRGFAAVARLAKIELFDIKALCDLDKNKANRTQAYVKRSRRYRGKTIKTYSGDPWAWKKMCETEDLDLVYIVTPWRWHTPMAVYSMECGKHAAAEVPAATSLEECWQLVETAERTGRHMMQLENCCYDFFELMTLAMVRKGAMGELVHAEAAYFHDLHRTYSVRNPWHLLYRTFHDANLYPTHGLGPIAQCLNICRGNQFTHMTSLASADFDMAKTIDSLADRSNAKPLWKQLKGYRGYGGNIKVSLIRCANGQLVEVKHDETTPQPYNRIHRLSGMKMTVHKYPRPAIGRGHHWLNDKQMRDIQKQFTHPLTKTLGKIARQIGGHGGMDTLMDYRLGYCLKKGLPLDQNVYDAATWSAVAPLSEYSIANAGDPIVFPDFTRGRWKTNPSLGLVDCEDVKFSDTKKAAGQLENSL